jgi:hypothetical protein
MKHKEFRRIPSGINRMCCGEFPIVAMSCTQSHDLSKTLAAKLYEKTLEGNAFAKDQLVKATSSEVKGWVCKCSICGSQTKPYEERDDAVKSWNTMSNKV